MDGGVWMSGGGEWCCGVSGWSEWMGVEMRCGGCEWMSGVE